MSDSEAPPLSTLSCASTFSRISPNSFSSRAIFSFAVLRSSALAGGEGGGPPPLEAQPVAARQGARTSAPRRSRDRAVLIVSPSGTGPIVFLGDRRCQPRAPHLRGIRGAASHPPDRAEVGPARPGAYDSGAGAGDERGDDAGAEGVLVAPPVFKTGEPSTRGRVGSIPMRSRQPRRARALGAEPAHRPGVAPSMVDTMEERSWTPRRRSPSRA